jgi:hypothetical protein
LPAAGKAKNCDQRDNHHKRPQDVAKFELTPSTPILAKIAVSAAKIAERIAQSCQDAKRLFISLSVALFRACDQCTPFEEMKESASKGSPGQGGTLASDHR